MIKKIEKYFKKIVLRLLLLRSSKSKSVVEFPRFDSDSRILFIRLNRIGDALVTTPLLRAVKLQLKCKTAVLADKNNYFIFDNYGIADEVIVFDKKPAKFRSLLHKLNSEKYDAVIDLHDDVSTTVSFIIDLLKIPIKIGFKKGTENLYTHLVDKLDSKKHHVIERVMKFSKLLNLELDNSEMNIFYQPSENSLRAADEFLSKNFYKKKFTVGINISAGSQARYWGTDQYKNLTALLRKYDINVLLMCAENDLAKAFEISCNTLPVFYRKSFDEFAAMIPKLNLLFTPDTSIVHVASVFKIPVFGIYVKYNTDDVIWYPYKSDYECVVTEEPTLKNIRYETVEKKFIPFLEKYLYGKRDPRL